MRFLQVDLVLLDALYRAGLRELRGRAESVGLQKSGSVEVVRARLIQKQILGEHDLSWDGIQAMPHRQIGEILKIFGIKSSGSHKERRQRLWLHLNHDSRRMTIERLAELDREKLHFLCQRLELPVTGNRTVLMGRVAGVLTSQGRGWGRIKRSLRRQGVPDVSARSVDIRLELSEVVDGASFNEESDIIVDNDSVFDNEIDDAFEQDDTVSKRNQLSAALEDARDAFMRGFEDSPFDVQGDLLTIQARVEDLDRMVGTILRGHGSIWGPSEVSLLLRLGDRRGWPMSHPEIRERVARIATDLAEQRGAELTDVENTLRVSDEDVMARVRAKLADAESLIRDTDA